MNEQRRIRSLPNQVGRKTNRSRSRKKSFRASTLRARALDGFSVLHLLPAKRIRDTGSKKKRRKDRRNGSGRGFMEKPFSSRLMAMASFYLKKRV